MEMAASAWAWLPIAARSVIHGPNPLLSGRVSTTVAPAARSSAARRVATSKLYAASVYPSLVWVPVVSHALYPLPTNTSWLMAEAWAPLPPLCPGSTTIVLPLRAPAVDAGASAVVLVGLAVVVVAAEAALVDVVGLVPPAALVVHRHRHLHGAGGGRRVRHRSRRCGPPGCRAGPGTG